MSDPVIVAATPTLFRYTHTMTAVGPLSEIYVFAQVDILAILPPGPLRSLFARTGLTDAEIRALLLFGPNVRVTCTTIGAPGSGVSRVPVIVTGDVNSDGLPGIVSIVYTLATVALGSIEYRHSAIR